MRWCVCTALASAAPTGTRITAGSRSSAIRAFSVTSSASRSSTRTTRKRSFAPATVCSVEPYLNCGHCIACRRGKGNCCVNLQVLGVHADGGMREQLIVPTNKLHASTKLSFDQLALVETLGIGCHAVSRAHLQVDEKVLILGAGPIGLSVIPFVQAAGATPIVADVSETRLAFCKAHMNVETTLDARADLVAQLTSHLNGELPTAVIDATGNPASMTKCFDLVAHGGRIVFVGLFQGDVTFNDPNFHRRECTLLASRNALPGGFRSDHQADRRRAGEHDAVDHAPVECGRTVGRVSGLAVAGGECAEGDAGVLDLKVRAGPSPARTNEVLLIRVRASNAILLNCPVISEATPQDRNGEYAMPSGRGRPGSDRCCGDLIPPNLHPRRSPSAP